MPTYEVIFNRTVLAVQYGSVLIEAEDQDKARELADDIEVTWTYTDIVNSEGTEIEDIREIIKFGKPYGCNKDSDVSF